MSVIGGRSRASVKKLIAEGNEHYRKGNLGDAIRAYNQAIKLDPENPVAWNNKGLILAVAGNHREALKCHMKAVELDPEHVDALSNVGMAYTKLGDLERALEWYDRALELDPEHETTWNNRGNLLSRMERYQEALECYDRALAIRPGYLAAMNNKAVELIHLKRYQEALALLDRVLKSRPLFAEGWYVKAKAYIGLREFEKAIVCLERSHRLNPDFAQAKKALDVLRRKLVEPPGARAGASRQVKKRPRTAREQERLEKSIQKEILTPRAENEKLDDEFHRPETHLNPDERKVMEHLTDEGMSKTAIKKEMGAGMSMTAIENALSGLEEKGLVSTSTDGRGKYYALTESLGSAEEEMVELKEKVELDAPAGNDFHSQVSAARRFLDRDAPREAARLLRKALRINPYDEMAICLLAQAQYDMGERDKAINTISRILASKPDFVPAWFTLANASLKHGQYKDAVDCYSKILEIQPDNAEAKKGLERARNGLGTGG